MVDGPVTNRRISRRLMRQMILGGVGALALVAVAGGAVWFFRDQVHEVSLEAGAAAEKVAKDIAAQAGAPFTALRARLVELGSTEELISAFEAGDAAALAALADRLQGDFESAVRLRLFLPGRADLEPDAQPPLSFASLDMLRKVEDSGAPVSIEMHLFGTPQQHIVLVAPALDAAGHLRGLLHLSLDAGMAQSVLDGINIPEGRAELRQSAAGKAVTLAAVGANASTGQPAIVAVPDTRWNIAYYPAGDGMLTAMAPGGGGSGGSLLLVVGAVILALGAGAWWVLRRRRRSTASMAAAPGAEVVYAGAVKAIMDGAHPGMEKLVPNLPDLGQAGRIAAVSQGMAGSDITMMVSRRELQASLAAEDKTPVPAATRPPPKAAAKPAPPAPVARSPSRPPAAAPVAETPPSPAAAPDRGIFRAYDIRGVVGKTLTADIVRKIGQSIGSEAGARKLQKLAVGRDGRLSSPEFAEALMAGLREAGRDVVDVGMVPTPLLYFATHELGVHGGVMVTGSHNGPEYNGFKIVLGEETLSEDAVAGLYTRIVKGDLEHGNGSQDSADVVAAYIRRVSEDIPVALGGALRIVVDCGNGVAGAVAPQLIRALGHDVIEMYCEVDGRFPNHHPDPSQPENVQALIERVRTEQADLGLAFDGDGDRLGVVDATGRIVWPDQQLMILAIDVLSRNPGASIIFDVKCSRHLGKAIEAAGGKAVMWRTGHSLIKHKMRESGAPLAGEMSGHIFFKERWYGFDDALYTAARLLEVLMRKKRKPAEVFAELPESVATPEMRVTLAEEDHAAFMEALRGQLPGGSDTRVVDIDGYRVEYPDGWGLVRPSNTSPALVVRFEADSETALARIRESFRSMLLGARAGLQLPF